VIYEILVAGKFLYVGLTVKSQSTVSKSLNLRLAKHFERARNETKNWPICEAIRKYGVDKCEISVVELVRGKKAAHARECELIKQLNPKLNLASAKKATR